ncbi:hypothetical protein FJ364_01375 [Candidatus Dependentiae bacterium]|nr:hypothetical protein [Candidatus Dependentiae bacterium]
MRAGIQAVPVVIEGTVKAVSFVAGVAADAATKATAWGRLQGAEGYQHGVNGLYKPLWTTLANTRVFNEAVVDDAAFKPKKSTRVVIPIPTDEELNEIASAPEPEEKVEEKRQTRSLVRKRNQEALRAANATVLGDEEGVLRKRSCVEEKRWEDGRLLTEKEHEELIDKLARLVVRLYTARCIISSW